MALRKGRLDDALQRLSSMPEAHRESYSIQRNRALALELMGRYDEALEALDKASAARPDDHDVHLARGIVYLKARDAAHSLDALRQYRTAP
jgi:tetratricopeptide (TPR) repeat protein